MTLQLTTADVHNEENNIDYDTKAYVHNKVNNLKNDTMAIY